MFTTPNRGGRVAIGVGVMVLYAGSTREPDRCPLAARSLASAEVSPESVATLQPLARAPRRVPARRKTPGSGLAPAEPAVSEHETTRPDAGGELGALPVLPAAEFKWDAQPFPPDAALRASSFRPPSLARFGVRRPVPLVPLYVSYAALQALDAVTTFRALDGGTAVEANPILGSVGRNRIGVVALKAGLTVSTIILAERLWKKNRPAAILLMAALDGGYLAVVAHNAHVAARR